MIHPPGWHPSSAGYVPRSLFCSLLLCGLAVFADEPIRHEPGARVLVARLDTWLPILDRRGHQLKSIVPGSEEVLADGDRPLVFDRERDYLIDYLRGLFKALPAGRIDPGLSISLSCRFQNAGPTPIDVDGLSGFALDGLDDVVLVPWQAPAPAPWRQLRLACRLELAADASGQAFVWGDPDRFGLALTDGRLTLLAGPARLQPPLVAELPLPRARWIDLVAELAGGRLTLYVDGQAVATRLAEDLVVRGPLRLQAGGSLDPHFLHGRLGGLACQALP